jgi:hypothetical protein
LLIRKSDGKDFAAILEIINDAAHAYRGVIPADRWHEPYMPAEALANEIADGVVFWVAEQQGQLLAVMGMQDKGESLWCGMHTLPRPRKGPAWEQSCCVAWKASLTSRF